ncbi:MAG TPA: SDR family oxidoreductase [Solirubrobacterales bacterium]|nr:SDR family oxidoreductase [Solirubrobacterales bacterium]
MSSLLAPGAAVVTGAGDGIGLAIAERLAADGWFVVGVERDARGAERFEELLAGSGAMVCGDVRTEPVLEAAVASGEAHGPLLGWVNNAALNRRGTLHEPVADEVREVFEVNLLAPFWGCSLAVRSFLEHGVPGRVVNISSIHATDAFPGFAAYDTAKGGVNALTRYLAVEYGVAGIRANAIAPGAIRTEMLAKAIAEDEDPPRMQREMELLHPLERLGTPAEVAAVAAFLLGDESSFVSGQVLGVDGGATARAIRLDSAPGLAGGGNADGG